MMEKDLEPGAKGLWIPGLEDVFEKARSQGIKLATVICLQA